MGLTPQQTLAALRNHLRQASLAEIGGFRPPDDPRSSWFGQAVCLPEEGRPADSAGDLFPMLQINVAELPFVPPQLTQVALLVVYYTRGPHPFRRPHGDGWLIREYSTLDHLVPLPGARQPHPVKAFPIRWSQITDDAPSWEDAWSLIDMTPVNEDENASDQFFDQFEHYSGTKVGGFPYAIQHGVGLDDFVFQIGSEEKAHWHWVDGGVAYFFKCDGVWRWDCQFY